MLDRLMNRSRVAELEEIPRFTNLFTISKETGLDYGFLFKKILDGTLTPDGSMNSKPIFRLERLPEIKRQFSSE